MSRCRQDRAREQTVAAALDATGKSAAEFTAHPKATTKVSSDLDVLLTLFDFPVEHHKHLPTTDVIESTFATVRLRRRTTKGARMPRRRRGDGYNLLDAAHARRRRVSGPELFALDRAGATFIDGQLQQRGDTRGRAA